MMGEPRSFAFVGKYSQDERPRLSIVVTIVDGGRALGECLRALQAQEDAPKLEVLVPFDDTARPSPRVMADHPQVLFIDLGALNTDRPHDHPAGQHELFDRRRSAGLSAAAGEIVAMLEDRGVPRRDWAHEVAEAHRHPDAVIGGAVENGVDSWLNWAVYFCDFGRYQLPFDAKSSSYVTDVNVSYKWKVLDQTRALWQDRYHETTLHWALQRGGVRLFLSPRIVVDQVRTDLRVGSLLGERWHWGRLFAYTRAREIGKLQRWLLAGLTPALPFVLWLRLLRLQIDRGRTLGRFLRLSPVVFVLLIAWSLGEAVGYGTRRP